jgi:hypothetical protein
MRHPWRPPEGRHRPGRGGRIEGILGLGEQGVSRAMRLDEIKKVVVIDANHVGLLLGKMAPGESLRSNHKKINDIKYLSSEALTTI